MRKRLLVPLLLALVVAPAAGGFAAPTQHLVEPGTNTVVAQTTATASGGSSGSGGAVATTDPANYTRLYIDAERPHLQLKPGESDTFTVTVENGDDHAVELDPHLYLPPTGGPVVEESWVTVDGPSQLAPDESAEFTVSVSVPEDAEIGRFSGQVAFTDQTVTYPGRPARPVHAEYLRVEVWQEPTVKLHSSTYVHAQVEAGEQTTREIVVENTGDEPVPLSPEFARERGVCHGDCPGQFDRSWLDVDAPSQVGPGETATVTLTIAPPADADRGRYDTRLSLGLKDPTRPDRDTYWQQVDLNVQVWSQPASPFETTFAVSQRADDVTVTLTPRSGPSPAETTSPAGFDVAFVDPNGSVVEATRVEVTDRGFVDMSGDDPRGAGDEEFAVRNGGTEFVYRLDDPEAGEWTLRVLPENTVGFSYEVTRDENS